MSSDCQPHVRSGQWSEEVRLGALCRRTTISQYIIWHNNSWSSHSTYRSMGTWNGRFLVRYSWYEICVSLGECRLANSLESWFFLCGRVQINVSSKHIIRLHLRRILRRWGQECGPSNDGEVFDDWGTMGITVEVDGCSEIPRLGKYVRYCERNSWVEYILTARKCVKFCLSLTCPFTKRRWNREIAGDQWTVQWSAEGSRYVYT